MAVLRAGDSFHIIGIEVRVMRGLIVISDSTSRIIRLSDDFGVLPASINWILTLYHRHRSGLSSDQEFALKMIELIDDGKIPKALNPFESGRVNSLMILDRDINGFSKGSIIYPENNLEKISAIMETIGLEKGVISDA